MMSLLDWTAMVSGSRQCSFFLFLSQSTLALNKIRNNDLCFRSSQFILTSSKHAQNNPAALHAVSFAQSAQQSPLAWTKGEVRELQFEPQSIRAEPARDPLAVPMRQREGRCAAFVRCAELYLFLGQRWQNMIVIVSGYGTGSIRV
jgi:hypothetical protein